MPFMRKHESWNLYSFQSPRLDRDRSSSSPSSSLRRHAKQHEES
jgi:hypothetical protein